MLSDLSLVTGHLSLVFGEVQEWLNWQHWKCCERGTVPWVRIPPSPPLLSFEIWNVRFSRALPNQ
jgi:hypothetical protein